MAKRLRDVCALPECARPRAQQCGHASRNQIEQSAQQLGYCSSRGRPHSAAIALGGIPNKVQAPLGAGVEDCLDLSTNMPALMGFKIRAIRG